MSVYRKIYRLLLLTDLSKKLSRWETLQLGCTFCYGDISWGCQGSSWVSLAISKNILTSHWSCVSITSFSIARLTMKLPKKPRATGHLYSWPGFPEKSGLLSVVRNGAKLLSLSAIRRQVQSSAVSGTQVLQSNSMSVNPPLGTVSGNPGAW